jgi:predicted  nucleic acid-binding Zn-ribbon protein
MLDRSAVEAALRRLDLALSALDAAVERRLDHDRDLSGLEDELSRIGEDRSRLAKTLDDEKARAGRLEDTNREVSRRLVAAMESIRSVLETHGS